MHRISQRAPEIRPEWGQTFIVFHPLHPAYPCELAIVELFELRSQIDHFTHDNECGPIRKRGLGVGELGKGEKWLVARRRARAKGQIQNLRFKISEELLLGGACSAVHACARIPSEVSC